MIGLIVYLEAPFAAFRTFTTGSYRPTALFLTPSAAYGLLLNVAGIETRLGEEGPGHDGKVPASLVRPGLPVAELAIGVPSFRLRGRNDRETLPVAGTFPRVQSVFQQLHNYPVGPTGKEWAHQTKGNKYNISPSRREFLSDLRAVIAVRTDADTEARIRQGLGTDPLDPEGRQRYGVPFLGDNAFLPDRIEELTDPGPVRWYERIAADSPPGVREHATRLTVLIDRADLSRTTSHLYAPGRPSTEPPAAAWTEINPPPTPPEPPPKRGRKQ
jgi:CRISPR-associated protein Cas5t